MTREEALKKVKGYLISYLPINCYEEIEEIIKALEEEPFINKPCISTGVCEHDKNVVLDKIRAEIIAESFPEDDEYSLSNMVYLKDVLDIIDKYKAESEK